jgi:hypothetical protein
MSHFESEIQKKRKLKAIAALEDVRAADHKNYSCAITCQVFFDVYTRRIFIIEKLA